MTRMLGALGIALLLSGLFSPAGAASDHRRERLAFKDGRATIQGQIKGYQYVDYVFPASAGESVKATLKTSNGANYFNLLAPGEAEVAFFIGSAAGENYEGVATGSGDYTARVYLMRSAARRGETARYALTIALGEKSAGKENGPDYADGLTGGPDFWAVTGVAAGGALFLRKDPSPRGPTLAQFANGTTLRNLGCKNAGGHRWCRVEQPDDPKLRGWVNGRFLREASSPK